MAKQPKKPASAPKVDPSRNEAPTQDVLKALPRWARVAFAVRCAQRVRPIFEAMWPDAPQEHRDVLDRAIALTARSARVGRSETDRAARAASAAAAARAAYAILAAKAADAAACADAAAAPYPDVAAAYAAKAADAAIATYRDEVRLIAPMWRDVDLLRALTAREKWTNASPVDPDLLGPLWPCIPDWWPKPKDGEALPTMQIDITVPPGMSEDQSRAFNERVVAFLSALSRLHAEMGGTGLRILDAGSCELEPAEDEAPTRVDRTRPLVGTGAGGGR